MSNIPESLYKHDCHFIQSINQEGDIASTMVLQRLVVQYRDDINPILSKYSFHQLIYRHVRVGMGSLTISRDQ